MIRTLRASHLAPLALLAALACGSDDNDGGGSQACTPGSTDGCASGQVCEAVVDGTPACFAPISLKGAVTNAVTTAPVEGATVVARDANGAAVSTVALTDAEGAYTLTVPVARRADGTPMAVEYTLRSDAAGFETFPQAPRTALPIDLSKATDGVVQSAATDISLLPLAEAATTFGTIRGHVDLTDPMGTLVIAGGVTALADRDGNFILFNVPPGDVTVQGYRVSTNLEPAPVTVAAGKTVSDVVLTAADAPAVSVSGKVSIVNPGDGSVTSVILVLADTFNENAACGEAPPGLRAANVDGDWLIEGVPNGKYKALAAFENDFLVRDPDTSQGNTAIVDVEVAGKDVVLDSSFKVTGSLDVISPDKEDGVTGTPTFSWGDDSGEDHYLVEVYDGLGNLVWQDDAVPGVTGSKTVEVTYGGDALTPGMIYQFRATSIGKDGTALSKTEDLRGVFRYE